MQEKQKRKSKKVKEKTPRPIKTPKGVEVKYRKTLQSLAKKLSNLATAELIPVLKQLQPEYVNDGYALSLSQVFDRMVGTFANIDKQAQIVAGSFVDGTNSNNRKRFYSAIEKSVGVDLSSIVQGEQLEDILIGSTRENVTLIKSIPAEYFKKIETIVFTGTTQGNKVSSMIKDIQKLNGSTKKRAKLIARDQTSKLNSVLNQQRQQNLGVEEYIWRTADDGKVREDHAANNGKRFRWDKPPKTGHPGEGIQCRCIAQPIIEI